MAKFIAALAAMPLLLVSACGGGPTGLPELRLGEELTEIYLSGHSALLEPTYRVIDSREDWVALWPRLRAGLAPDTAPEVDFGSSLVLVAGWGEVATGGFLIHVDSLVTRGSSRMAYVTRHRPGRCVVTLATTQPVHVVAAPRAGGPIEFVDRERTYDCE